MCMCVCVHAVIQKVTIAQREKEELYVGLQRNNKRGKLIYNLVCSYFSKN